MELEKEAHWPVVRKAEYLALYKELFSVKLKPGDEAYELLCRTMKDAKAKHREKHPNYATEHQAAVAALRKHSYWRSAGTQALTDGFMAAKLEQKRLKDKKDAKSL